MAGFAAGLTQQDIKNIAAHYSSQPAVLFTRY
jgi:cytochrome c553